MGKVAACDPFVESRQLRLGRQGVGIGRSPASRGRGLKHQPVNLCGRDGASPASRGRGLKHLLMLAEAVRHAVARFTRAWIETTIEHRTQPGMCRSPASRGRGLKPRWSRGPRSPWRVARFTRAWIETFRHGVTSAESPGRPLHAGVD